MMEDFPVSDSPEINCALSLVQSRYESLNAEKITPQLAKLDEVAFQKVFEDLPRILHKFLFQEIFSNAGHYRNEADKDNGVIYFGPRQIFRGFSPKDISEGLKQACSNLQKNDPSPCHSVTKFYQQFVLVHPFYDANGRIGRFMTDIYLNFHGWAFSWEKLHKNTKWLKKINACHKRYLRKGYEKYIGRLASHFGKCIIEVIEPNEDRAP